MSKGVEHTDAEASQINGGVCGGDVSPKVLNTICCLKFKLDELKILFQ